MNACKTFTATSVDTAALKRLRLELVEFLVGHLGASSFADDAATITAEILDNLLEHNPVDGTFEVSAEIRDSEVTLKFVDNGPAFDPLEVTPAESEPEIGGHGLRIVRALAADLRYERSASGKNILSAKLLTG